MPYDLKNYVTCPRSEMPKATQRTADQLESLGFTVEHHHHVKGGAHASQILHAGVLILGWCYGASLADFLKGAASMQTLLATAPRGWDKISADDPAYFLGSVYGTNRHHCCDVRMKSSGATLCTISVPTKNGESEIQDRAEVVLQALNR